MNENFSKNLRKLRQEKKLTQEQVAEKLGVSAQAVSRWETSVTFPDIMLLPEIARIYGVLVDDLFKESPQGYTNLADRLLAVYEDTYKHEDFMTAYLEFERMEKEGATFEELEALGVGGLRKAFQDGDVEMGSLMAGQSAAMVHEILPCSEIIKDLVADVSKIAAGILEKAE